MPKTRGQEIRLYMFAEHDVKASGLYCLSQNALLQIHNLAYYGVIVSHCFNLKGKPCHHTLRNSSDQHLMSNVTVALYYYYYCYYYYYGNISVMFKH